MLNAKDSEGKNGIRKLRIKKRLLSVGGALRFLFSTQRKVIGIHTDIDAVHQLAATSCFHVPSSKPDG